MSFEFRPTRPTILLRSPRYLSEHAGPDIAASEVDRILTCGEMLSKNPLTGRARNDIAPGCRSFVKRNYILYYTPLEIGIELMRVAHGMRDQKKALGIE